MHQTFYIDIEEEISSVVDRLNKSMSTDNYFVVPKRALFLQSVVNLKLLKREADKVGKKIFIVTQDEVGASMAERSGIEVAASVDEPEDSMQDAPVDGDEEEDENENEQIDPVVISQPVQNKAVRLKGVGSTDFYDSSGNLGKQSSVKTEKTNSVQKVSKRIAVNSVDTISLKTDKPHFEEKTQSVEQNLIKSRPVKYTDQRPVARPQYKQQLDSGKAKSLEKMFSSVKNMPNPAAQPAGSAPAREGRIKRTIGGFVILCVIAFIGTAAFLFWPSAKIIITPNVLKDKIDLDLSASGNSLQAEQFNIPVRAIDMEETVTLPYEISGSISAGGKKAHGSVVIYNEYDNGPQTLIATTRLESEDGKIFRLQKNTVVPGRTTIAGEVKPGAVSAEVVADQAGVDFNVGPIKFTIPGFKDGPKYAKFYAKSTEAMTGGSSDDTTVGGTAAQKDIDNAKQKTEAALTDKINEEIKNQLVENEIFLTEAEKITITKSAASIKIGDMVSPFNYTATASVRVLVFSENDVRSIVDESLKKSASPDIKRTISKIEYGTPGLDFDNNKIELRVHSEIISVPVIEGEQIKKEFLGKNDAQLSEMLRKYPAIKNINVEFSPSFVSRIPQYAGRVSVEIKNDGN